MKFLACSRLSEHRYKTPEGYLVCVDSILSRTGKQTYSRDELFKDGCTDEVEVERSAEEVFSEKTLASFENKPLTIEHPEEDVTPANHNKYCVGFIRDVKRGKDGSEDVMLGTIVVTDAEAIELIETGKLKELSCGYDCDIEDEDNPQQRNIRGNHVALCEHGRAGIARIVDSKCKDEDELPEEEDSVFRYSGARGEEIYVTNYDGRNQFLVTGGPERYNEKMMSRRDVEMYLDRCGARFSKVIRDSKCKDEQLYAVEFSYDGDSWSDYLGHVNVLAKSEQEALTKAKRWAREHYDNAYNFKIGSTKYTNVETIDVIKDAMFEICYIDNGDVCVAIEAKDENDARQKFHRRYGMYYIKHIRKIKDGVKDMKVSHDNIREQPVFVMQSDVDKNLFFYIGKTHAMKEGEYTYAQYDMEGMTPDELRKELEANGWHKVARGPAPFIDEDPYEESTKGLEEAEKNLHDKMICNTETDCKDFMNENDDVYVNVGSGIYHHAKLISKAGDGAFNECVVKDLVTGKTIKTIMNRLRPFVKDSVKKLDYKKLLSIVRAVKSVKK